MITGPASHAKLTSEQAVVPSRGGWAEARHLGRTNHHALALSRLVCWNSLTAPLTRRLLRVIDATGLALPRRSTMHPGARLLIVERILAPPNQGAEGKLSDHNMLVNAGGRERTSEEFHSPPRRCRLCAAGAHPPAELALRH
jgi:hypothetical protein